MRSAVLIAAIAVGSAGCGAGSPFTHPHAAPYPLPVPGSVPVELNKITLPPYVIEAPDQLTIDVVQILEDEKKDEKTGETVKDKDNQPIKEFKAFSLPVQSVSGAFSVQPDGCVALGLWGRVPISGLTLEQAAEAIRDHVSRQEDPTKPGTKGLKKDTVRVIIDVLQYNSKRYYVIFDGAGNGEQVIPFPITGSETVLDAVGNVSGLPAVASKRNVWVARRTPHAGQMQQILPVDWVAITQHGVVSSNYQLMPGDRVYVKSQKLVRLSVGLSKILNPVEQLFGVALLGSQTVNQIQGRGTGFNGN